MKRSMVGHGHVIPAGIPEPEDDEVTYTFVAAEEHLAPEQIRQLEEGGTVTAQLPIGSVEMNPYLERVVAAEAREARMTDAEAKI